MRFFFLLVILFTLPAQADRFVLRNGSTVQGTLINFGESPRVSYQIRLDTGGDVTLDADDVKKVIVPSPKKLKYQELLAKLPAETAENHWKMAEVCAKWSLGRERKFHLERTIQLEPNHAQARRALNHKQRKDGTWAELSEIMEDAGKVRQDGRWMSKQEAQLIVAEKERRAAEIQWKKKIRMWRGWLKKNRRNEALRQIEAIDDPMAVGPLVELFRSDKNANLREVLAEVLSQFDHGQATQALVEASMFGSHELQMQCIRLLEKNGRSTAVKRYLPSLRSKNNQLVRRAGYALGVLGDDQVVLPLIKALNTTHTRLVGGAGNGGINVNNGGGISAGRTEAKKVDENKRNKEVRSALVKLTGEDFDYNEQRWLDWYLARSTPPRLDLRREE